MLWFSFKNVFRKKTVAIFSSSGIAFGLMLMFVLGAYAAGVQAQFQDSLSRTLGIVQIVEENEAGAGSVLPPHV
jgi:ABC-type lipoprotein release transport system permease subunit